MDSCIGMMSVADESSLPAIEAILRRTPPTPRDDGTLDLIDTAYACVTAYRRASTLPESDVLRYIASWGPEWAGWAAQQVGKP